MRTIVRRLCLGVAALSVALPVAAQGGDRVRDRPFMFSVSASPTDVRQATVQLDSAFGASALNLSGGERAEQRVGIQASLGHRLTAVAHLGIVVGGGDVRSSQQGELLFGVLRSRASQASVAIGMGMRHEADGVNVLLGRIAAGRTFDAWRVDGNALFERPFDVMRDRVDLITSAGISRRVTAALHAGIEVIGQDLEGFWEPDEAEGGARLLVGPSVRVAPPSRRWQVSVAGGPMLRPTRSNRSSTATRSLGTAGGNYTVRVAFGYGF